MVHYNKARFIHIVALIILMPIPLILRIIYSLKANEEIKSIDGEIKSFVTDGDIHSSDNKTEIWIKGKFFPNILQNEYVVKIILLHRFKTLLKKCTLDLFLCIDVVLRRFLLEPKAFQATRNILSQS